VFSHFGGFCLNNYWSLDDYQYADISAGSCVYDGDSFGVTAPAENVLIWNETFTSSPFTFDEQNCSDTGHLSNFSWGDRAVGEILELDQDWYCFSYNKTADAVVYRDSKDRPTGPWFVQYPAPQSENLRCVIAFLPACGFNVCQFRALT